MAALARVENGAIRDARIALGSVAPVPIRLAQTERMLEGKSPDTSLVHLASRTAAGEVVPIDDIRSTARYRSAVVANLVAEFLEKLGGAQRLTSPVLERWNGLLTDDAENELLPCCGSRAWARGMAVRRPFQDGVSVLA